ncbi:hypothetical protein SNE40_001534 [Patella caerulea]|uniref:Cytochrome P450 n=1 Tax=Patella caerulea TaxID=87958 RepID=A0AAN8KHS5_PATCE
MDASSMLMILAIGTVIISIYCSIKIAAYIYRFRKKSAILKEFPYDPPHWFWGHLLYFPAPDEACLKTKRDRTARYNDFCLGWFGPILADISVTSPESVKPILKTSMPKGKLYRLLKPWLGDGLLLSTGEKWARNRRLLTPAFHFEILKPYLIIKNKAADICCSKISKFVEKDEYFEVFSLITMFTLDVILKCAFSYNTNCQEIGTNHPYVQAVHELSRILTLRFMKPWLHFDWVFNLTKLGKDFKKHCDYVHNVAEEIISKRREVLQKEAPKAKSQGKRYTDFLDILLMARDENGVGLTDEEIRAEVDTFLFEGHDTTGSALSWTLFSLAQHPKIQSQVQREIDELLSGRMIDDLMAIDLNLLPYLTMCIKESLRLHSIISFIIRHTDQDIKVLNKTIPKDTMTTILIYGIHHNPTLWEDSLKFQPERFSPENIDKINPFAYIPFSAGPRNCIGQNFALHEIKVLLVKILNRFHLKLDPNHDVRKIEGLVMKAEHGIKMKAKPRIPGQYINVFD